MKRADKWLSAAMILALIIPLAAILPAGSARAADIFSENFDSYVNGTLLNSSPGGWVQVYNGPGDAAQHVDNTRAVSGTQSLTLTGTSAWSAMAYRAVSFPSRFSYEAMIYSGGSAGQDNGWIGLTSLTIYTWYGTVRFSSDGYIYAWNGSYTQLMAYTPGAWYKVKVYMDLDARTFDVYIDGTLKGSNISIGFEGTPTGIFLETGNDYVQVWFDDVKVYDGATVTTNAATGVSATGATLNGTVNANGLSTTVQFKYGTTSGGPYGTTVAGTPSPVTGNSDTAVSAALTGLNPKTPYCYVVVGTNGSGPVQGSEVCFTTTLYFIDLPLIQKSQ